jgi:hypothetical protein
MIDASATLQIKRAGSSLKFKSNLKYSRWANLEEQKPVIISMFVCN